MTTACSPGSAQIGGRPVVGFIGLGDQGFPMAAAIAAAGFELHVWDRRPAALHVLGDTPHVASESAASLAAACDLVAMCVTTDDAVLDLAAEMLPSLRPGSILVNHGTGTPSDAKRLANLAAERGIPTLDAPVSGGRLAAAEHRLTTLVGGSDAALPSPTSSTSSSRWGPTRSGSSRPSNSKAGPAQRSLC